MKMRKGEELQSIVKWKRCSMITCVEKLWSSVKVEDKYNRRNAIGGSRGKVSNRAQGTLKIELFLFSIPLSPIVHVG